MTDSSRNTAYCPHCDCEQMGAPSCNDLAASRGAAEGPDTWAERARYAAVVYSRHHPGHACAECLEQVLRLCSPCPPARSSSAPVAGKPVASEASEVKTGDGPGGGGEQMSVERRSTETPQNDDSDSGWHAGPADWSRL